MAVARGATSQGPAAPGVHKALAMARQLKPLKGIRRFDVFAEYRKLDAEDDGMPKDQAKGYGLWVAKVVAARKFGRQRSEAQPAEREKRSRRKWHVLSGESQTDKLFDHEIVDRMGRAFYEQVFAPAVREARASGQTYEAMRDRLRRRWKPPAAAARASER
jgi:hypothetical protein